MATAIVTRTATTMAPPTISPVPHSGKPPVPSVSDPGVVEGGPGLGTPEDGRPDGTGKSLVVVSVVVSLQPVPAVST